VSRQTVTETFSVGDEKQWSTAAASVLSAACSRSGRNGKRTAAYRFAARGTTLLRLGNGWVRGQVLSDVGQMSGEQHLSDIQRREQTSRRRQFTGAPTAVFDRLTPTRFILPTSVSPPIKI